MVYRSPLPALVLVATLATSAATLGVGVVTADSQVAIQSATVDPETPRVGEDVTIRTTIRNFESATTSAEITQVSLRQGIQTLATTSDPGTIGTGGSIELPLTTTFESPGRRQLAVHVYGVGADGSVFNIQYPVSVTVNERDSDVQLSLETPTDPSTESQVNVTVANGASTNVSNLQLTLAEIVTQSPGDESAPQFTTGALKVNPVEKKKEVAAGPTVGDLAEGKTPDPDRQHASGDGVSSAGERDPEELSAEGLFHHAAAARVVTLWVITPIMSLVGSYALFSLLG